MLGERANSVWATRGLCDVCSYNSFSLLFYLQKPSEVSETVKLHLSPCAPQRLTSPTLVPAAQHTHYKCRFIAIDNHAPFFL
jgi:hypothetical protein